MPTTTQTTEANKPQVTRVVKFCINQKALTAHQRALFDRHAGTHRLMWNWGLSAYNTREKAIRALVREAAGAQARALFGTDDHDHVTAVYADAEWRTAAFAYARTQVPSTLPLTGKPITKNGLSAEFTALTKTGTPYGYDRDNNPKTFAWWDTEKHGVSRYAISEPLADLEAAIKDYYSGKSKRTKTKKRKDHMPSGWPTFKKKGRDRAQFRIFNLSGGKEGTAKVLRAPAGAGRRLNIPNLGSVPVHDDLRRLRRYIAKGGNPKSARFTQVADRWYVCINVSFDADNPYVAAPTAPTARQRKNGAVGVDLGVKVLSALSTGEMHGSLQPAKQAHRRKVAIQRKAAHAQRGSNRHKALLDKAARLDHLVSLRRATALHYLTKELTTRFETIAIEDLRLNNMTASVTPKPDPDKPGQYLKNGARRKAGLNRSMLDAALGELRRQLTYKSERHGSTVVTVNPAYTSEDCSACDHREKKHKKDKTKNRKSQAVFECVRCGFTCNADVNAAINIIKRHLRQAGIPWETMVGRVTTAQLSRRDRTRGKRRSSQIGQPTQALTVLIREDLRGDSTGAPPTTRSLVGGSGQPENPPSLQETA